MINSYYFKDPGGRGWEFQDVELDRINLFVGASGSGKTKFLNTLFNLARFFVHGDRFRAGHWKFTICSQEFEYMVEFDSVTDSESDIKEGHLINKEIVNRRPLGSNKEFEVLIKRTPTKFVFEDKELPKLQLDKPGITMLKEEESIQPLYKLFTRIKRRYFHDKALSSSIAAEPIHPNEIAEFEEGNNLDALFNKDNTLNKNMFLLKKYYPSVYNIVISNFKELFPTITKCDIRSSEELISHLPTSALLPVFCIKEKYVKDWLPLHTLSSGMQKVLLIMVDLITLPDDSIYIVDEYENSLGINAIDFLPNFLIEANSTAQFIITTHHPYLINNMPVKSWRIFSRRGAKVSIRIGEELEEKFGKSKQKVFTQLINDPLYTGV